MTDPYLETVTPEGLHFRRPGKGGAYRAALPAALPADAFSASWDPETLTLSYATPNEPDAEGAPVDPTEHTLQITQADIDAAWAAITTPRPTPVPAQVSKAQLKLALLSQGIDLPALVAGLPAEQQPVANILINDATHFERAATLVDSLGAIAGLSSEQVDSLFIAAAQINPAAF